MILGFVSSFQPIVNNGLLVHRSVGITTTTTQKNTILNVFGNKKSKKISAEEAEIYWQGEWVCKDCGYIYNRVRFQFMLFIFSFF
jgi:hypothetical protein